jgi:hypothetical protein
VHTPSNKAFKSDFVSKKKHDLCNVFRTNAPPGHKPPIIPQHFRGPRSLIPTWKITTSQKPVIIFANFIMQRVNTGLGADFISALEIHLGIEQDGSEL